MANIEIFNRMATGYDNKVKDEVTKAIIKQIKLNLNNTSNNYAIDYGCGTGLIGLELASYFKEILLVDASYKMIEVVQTKIDNLSLNNVKAEVIDLETSNNDNLKADNIIMVQVLLHIKEIEKTLTNLYNSLNSDGEIIIVDFNYNELINHEDVHSGFKHEELINTLKKLNFKDITIETFYQGKEIFMNKDAQLFILKAKK